MWCIRSTFTATDQRPRGIRNNIVDTMKSAEPLKHVITHSTCSLADDISDIADSSFEDGGDDLHVITSSDDVFRSRLLPEESYYGDNDDAFRSLKRANPIIDDERDDYDFSTRSSTAVKRCRLEYNLNEKKDLSDWPLGECPSDEAETINENNDGCPLSPEEIPLARADPSIPNVVHVRRVSLY